jgi:hypothetical protein
MTFKNLWRGTAVAVLLASRAGAVDNGLAITPQMGCEFPPLRKIRGCTDKTRGQLEFFRLRGLRNPSTPDRTTNRRLRAQRSRLP